MANPYWKKMEKSDGFRRLKLLLKRLDGREPWLKPDVTVNLRSFDCWVLCPDLLRPGQVVYSLGVGDTIDFDLELIDASGVEVHAFDPTPHSLQWMQEQETPENFCFHPWAASGSDGKLFLYPRVKSDGTKSKVMYTIVDEKGAADDAVEVPAYTVATMMEKLGFFRHRNPADPGRNRRIERRSLRTRAHLCDWPRVLFRQALGTFVGASLAREISF